MVVKSDLGLSHFFNLSFCNVFVRYIDFSPGEEEMKIFTFSINYNIIKL